MAISKITLNGVTQIDLTSDTVTASKLFDDYTAHGADGTVVTGSYVAPTARTSSDVAVSGATVTIPAGAYSSQVQKSVASGTAGTPTASKGAVNNHSIAVTPSVTNTTGYITGSTINGTAVTVSASELVSGSETKTANGTYDVTNLASLVVNVSGGGLDADYKAVLEGTAVNPSLPSGLTQIGQYKFYGMTSLTTLVLPNSVTTIGSYAFYGCTNLALTSLPSSLVFVNQYAFHNCSSLALTSFPSGLTALGTYAFQNCTSLALTSLPSGMTTIPSYAFKGCTSLALTSLPSGLTTINGYAFDGCTSLALSSLPSGLTTLDSYAFRNTGVTFSTLPSTLTAIGSGALGDCLSLATTFTLPSSIVSLSTSSFAGSTNLEHISGSGVITSLGASSFTGDSSHTNPKLISAEFPNMNISSLGTVFGNSTASYACRSLILLDLGNTQSIAASALRNCTSLKTIILRRTSTICTLANTSAFTSTPFATSGNSGTVYCPQSLISSYQQANNWKTLYDNGTVTFSAIEGSIYEL